MKIKMTADSKKALTLEDAEITKEIQAAMEEDTGLKDYAVMAVNAAGKSFNTCGKIYEVTAEWARNRRIWNRYTDNSRDIDIWLNIVALTDEGFKMIGAYLSDIWEITGDNQREIAKHFYVRNFIEEK